MTLYKISAIFPTITLHLMMAKYAEICCAVDVLHEDMKLETIESLKNLKF
jgi:hypothetical protein